MSTVDIEGVAWRTWRFGDRDWQREAWRLYDITGQLRFVANWVGNSVSRCRLYVAEVDESGEPGEEATDPEVAALAAGPLGQGPAKDEALRLLGINLFVPGECYIIAEAGVLGDEGDRWFVVSGRQIKRSGNTITIRRSQLHGGGDMGYRPGEDLILRVWTPHPADTDEPDSPARSAIPDLREIEALRKREFAELDSRLAGAGLLLLSQNMDFPRGDDQTTGLAFFQKQLQTVMATSIQNRASAEAMVPITLTGPDEAIAAAKLMTFWSELSAQLLPMREAAIRSLAQSLDIPAEILLGMADTNHWSSWQIAEETVTTQIVPVLSRIADALTTGYLQSALEEIGKDPKGFVYAFDTSPLTVRPNRSSDALNYHGSNLISDDAARELGAIRDDQKPDDQERIRRIIERAVGSQPALLADATIGQTVRSILGIEEPTATTAPSGQPALPPAEPPANPPPPQPQVNDPRAIPEQTPQTEQTAAAVMPVATFALRRALSLAGSRLVPHRDRGQWPDTPRHQLHVRHGQVTPDRAAEVLRGAWDDLPEAELPVHPDRFRRMLDEFAVGLLVRGVAFKTQPLRDLVETALRGGSLAGKGPEHWPAGTPGGLGGQFRGISDAAISQIYNYHDPNMGLVARVEDIARTESGTHVTIGITDASGKRVGEAVRILNDPDRPNEVRHENFVLDPGIGGQGFAARWAAQVEDSYRDQGIESISLLANYDVGGYAWARSGYDFVRERGRRGRARVVERLLHQVDMDDSISPEDKARFRVLGQDPESTPLEWAQVGRRPGDTMWPGKKLMLSSAWEGVKSLRETS